MREIRLYGSEGGGAEANRLSLPLSSGTLCVPCRRALGPGRRGASKTAFPRGAWERGSPVGRWRSARSLENPRHGIDERMPRAVGLAAPHPVSGIVPPTVAVRGRASRRPARGLSPARGGHRNLRHDRPSALVSGGGRPYHRGTTPAGRGGSSINPSPHGEDP